MSTSHGRWLSAALLVGGAWSCGGGGDAIVAPVVPHAATSTPPPPRRAWGMPRFFEVGKAVTLEPGAEPTDTTRWLETFLQRVPRDTEPPPSFLLYPEPDLRGGGVRTFALVLPPARPFGSNGRASASWDTNAHAFDFGLENARTFGHLTTSGAGGADVPRALRARFQYSGTNVQDAEIVYEAEGADLGIFEHKGFVPELPFTFERLTVYDRSTTRDDEEPVPVARRDFAITVGLAPLAPEPFRSVRVLEAAGHRILLATHRDGTSSFLAAPTEQVDDWIFGNVATDGVMERGPGRPRTEAEGVAAAAFVLRGSASPLLLSGTIEKEGELVTGLPLARSFLARFDAAMASLRREGASREFLAFYTHAFLDSHRSARDPRAMMELPYGDVVRPTNVVHASANVWYGSDQASVLEGLVHYERRTGDPTVVTAIEDLATSTTEAMTPSGSVWMKRFDEMLLTTETDDNTGRADAFIDNGGVSVGFNHARMVIRRGYERIAGVTWGAPTPVVAGSAEAVDEGSYAFTVDADALPRTVRTDQESLEVSRLFTRKDRALRLRETARLVRGVPAVEIRETVENIGARSLDLESLRIGLGDFFHYGDGPNEIAQNRYGFSRVFDGVALPVGFWMEGQAEPVWGDRFPPGWVDLSAEVTKLSPRFVVVFGYDKAQVYWLPKRPSALRLFNAGEGMDRPAAAAAARGREAYRGWTSLEIEYPVHESLAPGARWQSPPVTSYTIWAPLFSADGDTVPDELQSLVPMWADLVESVAGATSIDERYARLAALPDRAKGKRLAALLHTSLESDYAYSGMQFAWMETVDLLRDLGAKSRSVRERRELLERARKLRASALRGAEFSLRAMTQLRNRFDLMPAFGIMRYYGFHVAVFDWAYRETCDDRYREAMLLLANRIAESERKGGLQVTDPTKPNHGAFVINEFSRAAGANNLDDQGIKLWALRIAYERTGDPRYRRSAALCIDHWIKVRPQDHLFYGQSRFFGRYVATGLDQQRTPYGHYTLLLGLKAWEDLQPRARELVALGMKNATMRHVTHAVGTTGAYYMTFADEGMVHYGTNAELGGTFLWALSFDRSTVQRRSARCGGAERRVP